MWEMERLQTELCRLEGQLEEAHRELGRMRGRLAERDRQDDLLREGLFVLLGRVDDDELLRRIEAVVGPPPLVDDSRPSVGPETRR